MDKKLSHSFQSEHSPRGAEASFSMGLTGYGGGFSLETEKIGTQDLYIGFYQKDNITLMPYCSDGGKSVDTGMGDFIPTGEEKSKIIKSISVRILKDSEIEREYNFATDTWKTENIAFSIATPADGIADINKAVYSEVKESIAPAITARLTFDNTNGKEPMTGFFAIGDMGDFCYIDDITNNEYVGVESIRGYGFAVKKEAGIKSYADFAVVNAFQRIKPLRVRHAGLAGIMMEISPGTSRCIDIAFGWYRSGIVTLGKSCSYYYTNYFRNLTDVLQYALSKADKWFIEAKAGDSWLKSRSVSSHQQFLISKAIRSYYGSSQLLQEGRDFRWIINEGSCNMINTLDLTVDMAFYEAKYHPWMLKNVLDKYVLEYSYYDKVHFAENPDIKYPGGLSFTHDQGQRNVFTPKGFSHYELPDNPGCFSYMTHEELLNWLFCAGIYYKASSDKQWLHKNIGIFIDILKSMQNRDNPEEDKRNGIMNLDSCRCGRQSEITTYDSLDPSLGQARRNTYMGVKCWAGYVALEWLLKEEDELLYEKYIKEARKGARLAAKTITEAFDESLGYIPAILEINDKSAIIPIIEPLVYPKQLGIEEAVAFDGEYKKLISTLKTHLLKVLKVGTCLFEDKGWKLTSNNNNSWMSKIFLCQYVAVEILNIDFGKEEEEFHRAHDNWWRNGCKGHSVVDQVIAGKVVGYGSKYPRTVSAFLWLK